MTLARWGRAIAICAIVAAASTAWADENKAKAIALFDEGQKEMKAGRYEQACKAFEASNRILPDSGTRGSLARCYMQLGRIASAWTLWRELTDTAPTAEHRADAAAQAKKLEPRLAKYTVKIAAPVAGLTLSLDGKPVDASIEMATPIDPGTYAVEAAAPDHVAWRGEVTATEGKTIAIEVPPLAAAPATSKPPPVVDEKRGRGRRIAGVAIGGAGLGAGVVAGVFGVIARSRNEDAKTICGGDIDLCNPLRTAEAKEQVDKARSAATISTITAIAGGVALTTGIVLYLTAPKSERRGVAVRPTFSSSSAGIAISGWY